MKSEWKGIKRNKKLLKQKSPPLSLSLLQGLGFQFCNPISHNQSIYLGIEINNKIIFRGSCARLS